MQTYLTTANANAGRGTYPWANRTTALVDDARDRIKEFLGDPDPDRSAVHFTSGTTEGLRSIARDWLPGLLADGDEIVVPFADHRANLSRGWRRRSCWPTVVCVSACGSCRTRRVRATTIRGRSPRSWAPAPASSPPPTSTTSTAST